MLDLVEVKLANASPLISSTAFYNAKLRLMSIYGNSDVTIENKMSSDCYILPSFNYYARVWCDFPPTTSRYPFLCTVTNIAVFVGGCIRSWMTAEIEAWDADVG